MKTLGRKMIAAIGVAAACAALSSPAWADGDIDTSVALAATGGQVTVRFEGSNAGYDSTISVNGGTALLPNHSTTPGLSSDMNLGVYTAGSAIDVSLNVLTTGDVFHTGGAWLNADGMAHARLIQGDGRVFVSFEDMSGGGDHDFNDHVFSLTNVRIDAVPEVSTIVLLVAGLGLLGVFGVSRRQG